MRPLTRTYVVGETIDRATKATYRRAGNRSQSEFVRDSLRARLNQFAEEGSERHELEGFEGS